MPNYLPLDSFIVAPFKLFAYKPYGAFVNTTPVSVGPRGELVGYTIVKEGVLWPSAEHLFHALKIENLKKRLLVLPTGTLRSEHLRHVDAVLNDMLTEIRQTHTEYNPRNHYDSLVKKYIPCLKAAGLNVTDKLGFDTLCEADYHPIHKPTGSQKTLDFMREVIHLKFEQYPELANLAMDCAEQGIYPIEVSAQDETWASGRHGTGLNRLGIVILEEGISLLEKYRPSVRPAIKNPWEGYKVLQQRERPQALSHNALVAQLDFANSQHGEQVRTDVQYFTSSSDPHQRLAIQNGEIVAWQYHRPGASWENNMARWKFKHIVEVFFQSQGLPVPPFHFSYYPDKKDTKRLVIEDNMVVGYEFKKSTGEWFVSTIHVHFDALENEFYVKQGDFGAQSQRVSLNSVSTYYQHTNRDHSFKAHYSGLEGDQAKLSILNKIKTNIESCSTLGELKTLKASIAAGNTLKDELEIIKTGQDRFTRMFGLKTDSLKAVKQMFKDAEKQLEPHTSSVRP